jgi:acetylornithine/succinyldiaminopimelate/putrescine aminotransferase
VGIREDAIADRIEAAGLPRPAGVTIATSGASIAAAFQHGSHTDTFEGWGETDAAAADDVIRQWRLCEPHS